MQRRPTRIHNCVAATSSASVVPTGIARGGVQKLCTTTGFGYVRVPVQVGGWGCRRGRRRRRRWSVLCVRPSGKVQQTGEAVLTRRTLFQPPRPGSNTRAVRLHKPRSSITCTLSHSDGTHPLLNAQGKIPYAFFPQHQYQHQHQHQTLQSHVEESSLDMWATCSSVPSCTMRVLTSASTQPRSSISSATDIV